MRGRIVPVLRCTHNVLVPPNPVCLQIFPTLLKPIAVLNGRLLGFPCLKEVPLMIAASAGHGILPETPAVANY